MQVRIPLPLLPWLRGTCTYDTMIPSMFISSQIRSYHIPSEMCKYLYVRYAADLTQTAVTHSWGGQSNSVPREDMRLSLCSVVMALRPSLACPNQLSPWWHHAPWNGSRAVMRLINLHENQTLGVESSSNITSAEDLQGLHSNRGERERVRGRSNGPLAKKWLWWRSSRKETQTGSQKTYLSAQDYLIVTIEKFALATRRLYSQRPGCHLPYAHQQKQRVDGSSQTYCRSTTRSFQGPSYFSTTTVTVIHRRCTQTRTHMIM